MKNDIVNSNHVYKYDINYGNIKFVRYGGVHRPRPFWIRFCLQNEKNYIEIDGNHINITPANCLIRNSINIKTIYYDSNFKALEYILIGKNEARFNYS